MPKCEFFVIHESGTVTACVRYVTRHGVEQESTTIRDVPYGTPSHEVARRAMMSSFDNMLNNLNGFVPTDQHLDSPPPRVHHCQDDECGQCGKCFECGAPLDGMGLCDLCDGF